MDYKYITAKTNERIKYYTKLVASKKQRDADGVFVCEGLRLCLDAVKSGYVAVEVFVTEAALEKHADKLEAAFERVNVITEDISEKLTDTVTPQGIYLICKRKEESVFSFEKGKKYICLENVQNPQNLGAVARTAEALGISAVIVLSGCDVYNPKALRASMGSLLRIPVIRFDSVGQVLELSKKAGVISFAAVPDSNAKDITEIDFSHGALAVIGNEGNGVSKETLKSVDMPVTIVMKGLAESLNASAAADIVMWEMMR